MERSQMTFYSSFWDAINSLPKKEQLPMFRAVIAYGLTGGHTETLSQSQKAFFSLMQPVLDAARKKAANGKQTGSKTKANKKQNESKEEANEEQIDNKKENEKEKENEVEIEVEIDKEQTKSKPVAIDGSLFTSFWGEYPCAIGREAAWEAWKAKGVTRDIYQKIMASLEAWKNSESWTDEGGRYIPRAAKFITEEYWNAEPPASCKKQEIPKGASGVLGEAELEAIQRVLREG